MAPKTPILNLTQHRATPEQLSQGVEDPTYEDSRKIKMLLTFDKLPTYDEVRKRAEALADLARAWADRIGKMETSVMIGGAPYLMPLLEKALKKRRLHPVYAFSRRIVKEVRNPDGTVKKTVLFKHEGFIEVPMP